MCFPSPRGNIPRPQNLRRGFPILLSGQHNVTWLPKFLTCGRFPWEAPTQSFVFITQRASVSWSHSQVRHILLPYNSHHVKYKPGMTVWTSRWYSNRYVLRLRTGRCRLPKLQTCWKARTHFHFVTTDVCPTVTQWKACTDACKCRRHLYETDLVDLRGAMRSSPDTQAALWKRNKLLQIVGIQMCNRDKMRPDYLPS
jgi:hypothetical protein